MTHPVVSQRCSQLQYQLRYNTACIVVCFGLFVNVLKYYLVNCLLLYCYTINNTCLLLLVTHYCIVCHVEGKRYKVLMTLEGKIIDMRRKNYLGIWWLRIVVHGYAVYFNVVQCRIFNVVHRLD